MSEFFRALERADRERALNRSSSEVGTPAARTEPEAAVGDDPLRPIVSVFTMVDDAPAAEVTPVSEPPEAAPTRERRPLSRLFASQAELASDDVDEHLVSLLTPDTFEADQYRVLRHTVEQRRRSAGLGVLAVSSAGSSDGKTTTAINLAGALAQDRSARVLLLDCDLRSSAVGRRLGLPAGRGLVQAIVDPTLTLDDAIRRLPHFNLDVMSAGFETSSPYELLQSARFGELLGAARRRYDYVVVDTPPVVPFPDCRLLAKLVDGFLLVVFTNRTPRRLVDEALVVLPKTAVIGVVVNGQQQPLARPHDPDDNEDKSAALRWRSSAKRAWARAWRNDDAA